MEKYELHNKVLRSDYDGIQIFIKQGANLDELDDSGSSALHWAVMRGDYDMVKVLLEGGADVNVLSTQGFTPKWSAIDCGLNEIIELLNSYGGKVITDDRFDRTSWTVFKSALGQSLPEEE
ncbi:MAG: ankyrin-like [Mucilaginibacter sp.]|nr:ankyrin-like [Mucilaginibacter sp.]